MEQQFQQDIDYYFKSLDLLQEALHPAGTAPLQGNKRLALLGDSAMELSILDQCYEHKDTLSEGNRLLQRHACNSNLSVQGQQFGIDKYIERHPAHKGTITEGVRASTMEAILGAVWVDLGMDIHAVDRVRTKLGVGSELA